jgi:methionine synthase / methylenetetrahydrofolate reductase (NADH)
MSRLLEALRERVLLGDGAMGTEFIARGLPANAPLSELNLSRPELVLAIHRDYMDAGAELLKTNTFLGNALRLQAHGLEGRMREINLAGARLAREAAGGKAFVVGSVGPLADLKVSPVAREWAYGDQCRVLAEGGCDAILLETFRFEELPVALRAAKSTGLGVIAQCAELAAGLRFDDPAVAASDVVGLNCLTSDKLAPVLRATAASSPRPVSAMPSAGLPDRYAGPEEFADGAYLLAEAGARLLGGCCGAGPAHIRALSKRMGR